MMVNAACLPGCVECEGSYTTVGGYITDMGAYSMTLMLMEAIIVRFLESKLLVNGSMSE